METTTVTETREISRNSDLEDVIRWCQSNGISGEVVGRWVWVSFDDRPPAELRSKLKAAGFRWSKRRRSWAHNCGYRVIRSARGGHPRDWYGSVPVADLELKGA